MQCGVHRNVIRHTSERVNDQICQTKLKSDEPDDNLKTDTGKATTHVIMKTMSIKSRHKHFA